jgi:hypothetical protein
VRSGTQTVKIFVDLGVFPAQDIPARVAIARQLGAIAVGRFEAGS